MIPCGLGERRCGLLYSCEVGTGGGGDYIREIKIMVTLLSPGSNRSSLGLLVTCILVCSDSGRFAGGRKIMQLVKTADSAIPIGNCL